MRRWSGVPGIRIVLVVVLALSSLWSLVPDAVRAAGNELQQTLVRIDNMNASSATTGSVCFEPKNTANIAFLALTFPTGFTVSGTSGNWTTSTSVPAGIQTGQNYWPSGFTTLGATPTFSSVSGQTVTFSLSPAQSLASANLYCFRWTNTAAVSTGLAGVDLEGSLTTETAGPAVQDANNYALTVLASPGDQVTVNAVVPPIFEFVLSRNSVQIPAGGGNMDYTVVNVSDSVDATVTTNAKGGWIMWAKDTNQGLTATASGAHIPTVAWVSGPNVPTALSPGSAGTAQTALGVTARPAATTYCSTSNLTVDPEYNTAGNPGTDGGPLTANFAEIGTCTGNVSGGDGLRLIYKAAITPITPAATDYTDIVTVVGAGNF